MLGLDLHGHVREDGGRLIVDIFDHHDHTKPDAVGRAKGLSAYAAAQNEQRYGESRPSA